MPATLTSCSLSIREIAARTEGVNASARPVFERTSISTSSTGSCAKGTYIWTIVRRFIGAEFHLLRDADDLRDYRLVVRRRIGRLEGHLEADRIASSEASGEGFIDNHNARSAAGVA